MGDNIVNLRQARKRKRRSDAESKAEANRQKHGVPGQVRRKDEAIGALERARLEAHRRNKSGDNSGK